MSDIAYIVGAIGFSVIDEKETADIIARNASIIFDAEAAVITMSAILEPIIKGVSNESVHFAETELAVAAWTYEHGRVAGASTDTLSGSSITCFPMTSTGETIGVLALRMTNDAMMRSEQHGFIDSFLRQATLAVERARLGEEARASSLRIKTEEMRSALLSTVSHDLRTPLAAITGAGLRQPYRQCHQIYAARLRVCDCGTHGRRHDVDRVR